METPEASSERLAALSSALEELDAWMEDYQQRASGIVGCARQIDDERRPRLASHERRVREAYVMERRAAGETNKRIAEALGVSAPRVSQIARRAQDKGAPVAAQAQARAQLKERRAQMQAERSRVEIEHHLQEAYLALCRSYGRDVWRDDRDI